MSFCRNTAGLYLGLIVALCGCSEDEGTAAPGPEGGVQGGGAEGPTTTGGTTGTTGSTGDSPGTTAGPGADGGGPAPVPDGTPLPLVFVHGFAGSAQQFMSQAMRFEANGYPVERMLAYEHDGAGFDIPPFVTGLAQVIDGALQEFGVEQVYLMGHSRGTFVSSSYLMDPTRAAKVAKYISLDGSGCGAADMAGVPCIAPNQGNLPGQAHVEVATSAESFVMQYEFLMGEAPEVTEIVEQDEPVVVSGRAVLFPQNVGRAGVTLEVWPLKAEDGYRATEEPLATFPIDESGDFGPVTLDPDTFYEMVLVSDEGNHHFYAQRILRSTKFLRLLSGEPTSSTSMNTNTGDGHAALIAMRNREWKDSDVLEIGTTSASAGDQAPVDVIPELPESTGGSGLTRDPIALHLFDDAATPGESSLAPLPYFPAQPFQNGVDLYMPAADPPDGVITVTNHPYGDSDRPQVLRMPNWASSGHRITVTFSDFTQD